jgi:hypothetical protein
LHISFNLSISMLANLILAIAIFKNENKAIKRFLY